jgi:pyrophosphate--fructose-6-phosphate 1-phosphotransferase
MMGRSASHLTLECALQTQINLALIGEEISHHQHSLSDIVKQLSDMICERAKQGKNFGVVLVPEGLLEFIPECQVLIKELNHAINGQKERLLSAEWAEKLEILQKHLTSTSLHCFQLMPKAIQAQLLLDRDPHGNVQLSKIETERLLIELVKKELDSRQESVSFSPQPLFCGYEGRSGLPTNFDCNYCYALGHVAALLIHSEASGYICSIKGLTKPVKEWEISGVPIVNMLHFEIRKNKKQAVLKKGLVDLKGKGFGIYKAHREHWLLEDDYLCPGPIQFFGPAELTDRGPLTL